MKSNATTELDHSPGRGPHGASHPGWQLRRESAIWVNEKPYCANMLPLASEMCEWLQQKISYQTLLTETEKGNATSITNPYAYYASTIGATLGGVIHSTYEFIESDTDMDPREAEIKRIRLYSELVLYTARFCEATIKQMLFCTAIPRRLYKRASLGTLLAQDCDRCRKSGKPLHDISLLGALAHQYFMCHVVDHCVLSYLPKFGQRRNVAAAHSDTQLLNIRDAKQSRADLAAAFDNIGNEFGHMLDHIGEIEHKTIAEIDLWIQSLPGAPTPRDLMKIPARPPSWMTRERADD